MVLHVRPKIYFLTTWYDKKGGAETVLENLAIHLKDNYNIYILVFNPENNGLTHKINGITVKNIKTFKFFKSFSVLFPIKLMRIIKEFRRADILFSHQYYTFPSLVAALSSLIWNIPFILKPIAPIPTEYPPNTRLQKFIGNILNRTIFYFSLKMAKLITVTSNFEKRYLLRFYTKSSKIMVIRSGIDNVFHEYKSSVNDRLNLLNNYNIPMNSKIILYVGRISEMKGLSIIVKTLSDILMVFPNTYLFIVGKGNEKYEINLKFLINQVEIEDNVIFTGYINNKELVYFYAIADVFVNPSFMEISPLAVREAIAMRLPVVATNVGGTSEYIRKNLDGLLVPPGNKDLLFKAIINILSKWKRIKIINPLVKQCTFNYYNNQMKNIFEDVLNY